MSGLQGLLVLIWMAVTWMVWIVLTLGVYPGITASGKSIVRKSLGVIGLTSLTAWALWVTLRVPINELLRLLTGFWAITLGVILISLLFAGSLTVHRDIKAEKEARKREETQEK